MGLAGVVRARPMSGLQAWQAAGCTLQAPVNGLRVFCRDVGSASASPERTLLLLHGFPESSYSYHKVLPGLAGRFERVVLFDFIGYGFSDKPAAGYAYSLFEQADLALHVWRALGVRGGHLLSHDMGDSVATELAARQVGGTLPAWFSAGLLSFTFTNGNMVLDLAKLRAGQKLLLSPLGPLASRLASRGPFERTVRSAHGPATLGAQDIDELWQATCLQDGHRKNHLVIRYLEDRARFEKTRWLPALSQVSQPVHISWGEADAVAPVRVARYLKDQVCPRARLTLLPGVGHFCQLSDPEPWLASVLAFYE